MFCLTAELVGRHGHAVLAVVLMVLLGGCAAGSGGRAAPTSDNASVADSRSDSRKGAQAAPAAQVAVEAEGFTVTETVTVTGEARSAYRQAASLLAQGDLARGIELLLEVTNKVPDATAPYVDLGIAYARAGQLAEAESSLGKALAATPNHPVAHNELGIVYRKQGRFVEARQSYERALSVYPGFHYARRNLAVLCDLYLTDLKCALEHYEIYREAVLDDSEVNIWVGDIKNRIAAAN